jgi:hypothetical protein
MTPRDWMADALCAEVDTDVFFPDQGGTARPALEICARCTVRLECLRYALEHELGRNGEAHVSGGPYGIYGMTRPRDRRKLLNRMRGAA